MRATTAAAAVLLLLACCAGRAASARPFGGLLLGGLGGGRPACQGVTPAAVDVGGLMARGANGVIELSWQPEACATSYSVLVDREDIAAEQDNELGFNVTTTKALVTNVANASPYIVQIVACNGPLCGPKVALRVTPSGLQAPALAAAGAATGAVGVMPAVPAFGASLFATVPLTQWKVVMKQLVAAAPAQAPQA